MVRQPLPIDSLLPAVLAKLRNSPNLIIEAAPGAGKTTRVPPALLDAGVLGGREIVVLEPRRLATRLAASRVAEERDERLGETIGYTVRFEDVAGPRTKLRFVTEGVLTRRLLADPMLRGIGAVLLDEFHERHLQADLALALLRRLQRRQRPDLKLVVMSATIDAAPVASFLGDCPVIRAEGRLHQVSVEHIARPDTRPLSEQVLSAVKGLIASGIGGDILVFLPGAAEIRSAMSACQDVASSADLVLVPLHGQLSMEEQDRAVRRADRRKVILSTNVAESSVTIDGVVAVIDSGLARIAGHSPWSGLPQLSTARISRASAVQRAGRAGRTQPGQCLRLYTQRDFEARPQFDTPEVMRQDLAEPVLELHGTGVTDPGSFEWYEHPPETALCAAESLLRRLKAIDDRGGLTTVGRRMLDFPLHPRQSRLLVESEVRGVAAEGGIIAALIGEGDILASSLFRDQKTRRVAHRSGPSDLLDRMDLFHEAMRIKSVSRTPERLRELGVDAAAVFAVERVRRQLERILQGAARDTRLTEAEREEAILVSILAGYPDRVARRRVFSEGGLQDEADLLLSSGGQARLSTSSVVRGAEFLVAVEADDARGGTRDRSRTSAVTIRLASAIKVDWLFDYFFDAIRETEEANWNPALERVEVVRRMFYDQLILDERALSDAKGDESSRVLAKAVAEAGIEEFAERSEIDGFLSRLAFLADVFPDKEVSLIGTDDVLTVLGELCEGKSSFAELRAALGRRGLVENLRGRLTSENRRLLGEMAPERVSIAGRSGVPVHYEVGKTPWIVSRVQDFFGMTEGPRIAGGRVNIVLHLLAPNQRPVQVTSDLAGFWEREYPRVRRELRRRYPRHAWPENPLTRV
jgi:ATP-dependent helicase HrpB